MKPDVSPEIMRQLTESLRSYVASLKESGVTELSRSARPLPANPTSVASSGVSRATVEPLPDLSPVATQKKTSVHAPKTSPVTREVEVSTMSSPGSDLFSSSKLDKVHSLEELRTEISDCRRCKLRQGRTNIVFGVGDPHAEVMFVGEGPGRDEDIRGEPFVGRAGQLLTEIITKGMKMRRDEVYIANVVKCRPPDNRNPEPDEITACQPFLMKQVELVKPRIIIALGTFAAQTLLQNKTPISRLRGVWHSYQGVKLMPTLHPAYLLRNPNDKRLVWQDIQAVLREMGRL
ncbi:MAG: uracil-DNA glycosylase [Deltaproteobacteria bacterium]|nr:uracil-DNA glycosylase [Deltaproteobacteria bacterium]